jgi:hypothetical protein
MVSLTTLEKLPDVKSLKKLTQSLSLLDALLCRDWQYRYNSFNSKWNTDEMLASMRNGGGDEYFILFNSNGAILKGFDHESVMNVCESEEQIWSGVIDSVPATFKSFLDEPAFSIEYTTFCIWRQYKDSTWQVGNIAYPNNDEDADGSGWLLFLLDGNPVTYKDWAEDYYERKINLAVVEHIYQHKTLTDEIISSLAEVSFQELANEIEEIGYPKLAI